MQTPEFLKEVAEWFTHIKAPDLKEKVAITLEKLEKEVLEENHKKLLGFMLFTYCMNNGPKYFVHAEETAIYIGVMTEMEFYAKDWIEYSKRKSAGVNPGTQTN